MNATTAHPAPEEIMAFFDHELAPRHTVFVSAHIDECPDCSAALANFTSTALTLANWRVPPISPLLSERILRNEEQIRSGLRVKKPSLFVRASFWSWKQWTAGLGAVAATLLFIAMLFISSSYRFKRAEPFIEATRGVSV
jgi:hypothetical protein